MVAQGSKGSERVEGGEALARSSGGAEALAADLTGKEALVKDQKEADKQRKEGKLPTKITKEFGPLLLIGLENLGFTGAAKIVREALLESEIKKNDAGPHKAAGSMRAGDIILDFTPGESRSADIDPGFVPKGTEKTRDVDPGFVPKGTEKTRDVDPGFVPKGTERTRDVDPGFVPDVPQSARAGDSGPRPRVDVVDGKVVAATTADGHGREFKYEGGQLTEVKSSFTGHTWKRRDVDGKEEWVNEKGTVWKGKFKVDAGGNLTFGPHDGNTTFVFTSDGQTLRVPRDASAAPGVATDGKPAERPAPPADEKSEKPADATGKQADSPTESKEAQPKPSEATSEPLPLSPEQEKAAEKAGQKLAELTGNPLRQLYLEDAQKYLYGKTEAEIKAIDAAFKKETGHGLEEQFNDRFHGSDLDKALDLLRHKDKDLLQIPEGLDRAALIKANALIESLPLEKATENLPASYPRKLDPSRLNEIFEGKTPAELQAMNVLFKDCYGISLEQYLKKNLAVPLKSLDQYAKEANDAKAAKENFESEVQKVDQTKIAAAATALHDSTGRLENFALAGKHRYDKPRLGEHPAEKAIQDFTPAEMEALKRHYKQTYNQDIKEIVKDVPHYGESLQRLLDRTYDSNISRVPVEKRAELREAAQKVWHAFEIADPDGTDEDAFYKIMEGRSAAERAAIGAYYFELTGRKLEEHTISEFEENAAELEKALNYLRIGSEVESANVHLALTENNAAHAIERIGTISSPEALAETEKDFQERYGKSLREAIKTDDGMTPAAREALLIFLDSAGRQPDANGRKMTDEEWLKVMDLSLQARKVKIGDYGIPENPPGDLKMFQNIAAQAPAHVLEMFWKNGGEQKVEDAFPDDGSEGDAKDYARYGRISVERIIKKSDRVDDDEKTIVKGLDNMDQTERKAYLLGARIFKERYLDKLPEGQRNLVLARMHGESAHPSFAFIPEFDPRSLKPPLTPQELAGVEKFKSVGAAIDGPADDEEHRDWRDRAVYSGGVDKATEYINQLPWEKLQEIKADRDKFFKDNNFDLLSEHARNQLNKLLDKKVQAEKPEDLKYAEGNPLKDVLKLDNPMFSLHGAAVDRWKEGQKIVEGIMQMPLSDQKKYREDKEYRELVDARIEWLLEGQFEDAAKSILSRVAKGEYPVADWIDNINIEAGKYETSEPRVIRYVEEEFRKDHARVEQLRKEGKPIDPPELRERIAKDQALKDRLDKALRSGLDADEYEKWAKPVLEHGKLTFEQKMQLNKEDGDKEDVYKDLTTLVTARDQSSVEERRRLATEADFRQKVIGHLPAEQKELAEKIIKQSALVPAETASALANAKPEERKQIIEKIKSDEAYRQAMLPGLNEQDQRVAIRVLELGPVLPEDAIRAYKIGAQPNKEELMETLRAIDKNQTHEKDVKAAYADAFHEDIGVDLASKLGGKDERQMERLLRDNPKTARELYFRTIEEAESANSGFAADLTEWWGSQAGDMAEDSARQMYARITRAAERGEEIAVDDKELQKLAEDAVEYTEIFYEAKQAAVDAVAGIALSIATIAVPGGLSLKLLYWTAGGGIGKVALKAAMLGKEYDGEVLKDFVSGAVDTAFSAVGGSQIAKVMRLGSKVGAKAAEEALESGVVKPLLKESAEVLETRLQRAAAEAVADGSGMISDKAIAKIVDSVVIDGATQAEKALLTNTIKTSFANAIKAEVREGAQKLAHDAGQFALRKGLDAASGYVGGFAGGFTSGLFAWDSSKSWDENLSMALDGALQAGKYGLVGGAAFSTGFSVVGSVGKVVVKGTAEGAEKLWHIIRRKDLPGPTQIADPEVIANAGYFAIMRSKDAPHPGPRDKGIEVTADDLKSFQPVANTGYFIGEGGVLLKKVEDLPNGKVKLVRDQHAVIAARPEVAAKIEEAAAKSQAGDRAAIAASSEVAAKLENQSSKVVVDMDATGPVRGTENTKPQQPLNIRSSSSETPEVHGEIGGSPSSAPERLPHPRLVRRADVGLPPAPSARAKVPDGHNAPEIDDPDLLAVGDTTRFDLRPAPDHTRVGQKGAHPGQTRADLPTSGDPHGDFSISDKGGLQAVAGASDDLPPLVKQILDAADVPVRERAALLARINESGLANPEVMESFLRHADKISSGWSDVSDVVEKAHASSAQMKASRSNFERQILAKIQSADGRIDERMRPLLDQPGDARIVFNDVPELVRAADEYILARALHAEAQKAFHAPIKQRIGQLQEVLDTLADELGQPRVKLAAGDQVALGPSLDGKYTGGKILLKNELLLDPHHTLNLRETIYHEFIHHEQANLMIRGVVDDVEQKIGRPITAQDYARYHRLQGADKQTLSPAEHAELDTLESTFMEIRQRYQEKTNSSIPREQLDEVLRVRNERHLTPDERARAEALYVDWKNMKNPDAEFARAGTNLRVIGSTLEKLDDPSGTIKLVERLDRDNGSLSRHLFGQDSPPPQLQPLLRTYKKVMHGDIEVSPEHKALMEQRIRTELKALLDKRKETLEAFRSDVYKQYVSGRHELEAFVIGRTMRTRAEELGEKFDAADTGSFRRAALDDEDTGVFKRAEENGENTGKSNGPAASIDPPDAPGNNPGRKETAEESERIGEWEDEPKTVADPEAQRPPVDSRSSHAETPPEANHDASARLVPGHIDVVPAGRDGGPRLNIEGREYDLVARHDDVVYARVAGGRERPLGESTPVDGNNMGDGKRFQPIGDSGYYRDATNGDVYLLRRSTDGSMEMVVDPNVKPLDSKLSEEVSRQLDEFDRINEWKDSQTTVADPEAQRPPLEKRSDAGSSDAEGATSGDPLDQPRKSMTRTEELEAYPEQKKALDALQGDRTVAGQNVKEEFPIPTQREHQEWRQRLEEDLKQVPVDGADNVYEKIRTLDSRILGPAQKERIFNMLADVRAHYERLEPGLNGYQGVNWKHTRGEIDQVLEAAMKRNLTPEATEDAILASIFSDSVKFPPGDRGNFIVHHMDGAMAAAEILPRYFDVTGADNMARVEGIIRAIREHQIAPPKFMANFAVDWTLRPKLLAQGTEITPELDNVLKSIHKKMSRPFDPETPLTIGPDGSSRVIDFTPEERDLLKKIGIDEWYVPHKDTPWYNTSRAVIDGDGLINYSTPDGFAKIAAIRGPGTGFQDTTVRVSVKSAKQSYDDAFVVMTPEGQELARAGLARTEQAQARVERKMEEWLNSQEALDLGLLRNKDGSIPFWDADLQYPLTKKEMERLAELEKPGDNLSEAQRKDLSGLQEKRFLWTPEKQQQFDFAMKIRERMVKELRDEQTVFMKPGGGGDNGPGGGGGADGSVKSAEAKPSSAEEVSRPEPARVADVSKAASTAGTTEAPLTSGDVVQVDGEGYRVVWEREGNLYVMSSTKPAWGDHSLSPGRYKLDDYDAVQVADTTYFVSKQDGRVYRLDEYDFLQEAGEVKLLATDGSGTFSWKDGDGQQVQVRQASPEATEAFDQTVPKPNKESANGLDRPDRQVRIVEETDGIDFDENGKAIPDSDTGSKRTIKIEGREYRLVRDADDVWYTGKRASAEIDSPLKVTVEGVNGEDLRRLQQVLIPALEYDPSLSRIVDAWKTMDPKYATGDQGAYGIAPGLAGQESKLFTIYAKTPEDARAIQKRIDEILSQHPELRLDRRHETGNLASVDGQSQRVGIVRDRFWASPDSTKNRPLVQLDRALVEKIIADPRYSVAHGQSRLTEDDLRAIEKSANLQAGTLDYDSHGNLVLELKRSKNYRPSHGQIYVSEEVAATSAKAGDLHLRDRQAIYALAEHYGTHPVDFAGPPEFKRLLEDYEAIAQRRMSRTPEHDSQAAEVLKALVHERKEALSAELQALEKTYRHRPHEREAFATGELARRKAGGQVSEVPTNLTLAEREYFGVTDTRELGAPREKPASRPDQVVPAKVGDGASAAFTARIGNQELSLNPGQRVLVGNKEMPGDDVSRFHLAVGRDQEGVFIQDLKARGGTWLKREGQTDFTRLDPEKVYLRPGDKVRLGGPTGPEWRPDKLPLELRNGTLTVKDSKPIGGAQHNLYEGTVALSDGSHHRVIVHELGVPGTPGHMRTENHYARAVQVSKLNAIFGFDNGFPTTVRHSYSSGGRQHDVWVQGASGDVLETKIREIAREKYKGTGGDDDVVRLVREDETLRDQLEQAFVERLVLGDPDDHALNFVMVKDGNHYKVQNIDPELVFQPARVPIWDALPGHGVNQALRQEFSQKLLSAKVREKLDGFLKSYDSHSGRADLEKLGLSPAEIDGMISRVRWLVTSKHFPKAETDPSVHNRMQMAYSWH